ncbi:MAG TPA: ABC transporter substrate-binding protein, partial [Bacillota bacterium]
HWPDEVEELPRVTRSALPAQADAATIARTVRQRRQQGLPLYELDQDLLEALEPDLVIGQDVCASCALPGAAAAAGAAGLKRPAKVLTLEARRLDDIFANIRRVATALGAPARGDRLVRRIQRQFSEIARAVAGAPRPKVFAVEWIEPLKSAGGWVPELIAAAGGRPLLGAPGDPVREIAWEALRAADPEVVLIMPCGMSIERARREVLRLEAQPGWRELAAVRTGRVYLVDGRICSKHGPRVGQAAALLARLLHPQAFADPLPAELAGMAEPWPGTGPLPGVADNGTSMRPREGEDR